MGKQIAVDSLRESIRLLEIQQAEEGKVLKEELLMTYESLKPANLLKSAITGISRSSEIKRGFLETIIPVFSAYLTQRMFVRPGRGIFRKLLGTMLQFGVTSLAAKNAGLIRNFINQQFERVRVLMEERISSADEDGQQVAPAE